MAAAQHEPAKWRGLGSAGNAGTVCVPTFRAKKQTTALALVASAWLLTFPAFGYRTAHDLDKFASTERVRWATDEIHFTLNDELPATFSVAESERVAFDAFDAWAQPSCSGVRIRYEGVSTRAAAREDGANTIQFLYGGWESHGFDPTAAAITDIAYERVDDGAFAIVEADVYINAESFQWTLRNVGEGETRDFLSVLTHEAGHVVGLLHPCELGGAGGAPDCDSSTDYASSSLYPVHRHGQSKLTADDVAGVCFLYPRDCDGGACNAPAPLTDAGVGWLFDAGGPTKVPDAGLPSCPADGGCGDGGGGDGGGKVLGDPCEDPGDCNGDRCLAVDGSPPICTRNCGEGLPECPETWACSSVDGDRVCTPHELRGGGGCAVAVPHPSHGHKTPIGVWVVLGHIFACAIGLCVRRNTRVRRR